jgi:MFS family permease
VAGALIASLGWVFDVFEGQIFVASMNEAMPTFIARDKQLSPAERDGLKQLYNNVALALFLAGGATGGILFGMLSDRIGRKRTMSLTILFYSLFTCLSAFSMEWWHLAGFRFLVALGVGGEWAVASALVFEVFPNRARAHVGGIFHASSVFGTYLAVAAGVFIIGNAAVDGALQQLGQSLGLSDPELLASLKWRVGFALGALPALLIIWIRSSLREPESWEQAHQIAQTDAAQQTGRVGDLFQPGLLRNTLVGFTLAAVGMATFWGVHINGKNKLREAGENQVLAKASSDSGGDRKDLLAPHQAELMRWEMLGMFLVTTGGFLGLLAFSPISQQLGRRGAFLLYHLGGLGCGLVLFSRVWDVGTLYYCLPLFGFMTLGMHAGYAIYFPELFPTRLRGTGSGFCFNGGRFGAAPLIFGFGWIQQQGLTPDQACLLLSTAYIVGAAALLFANETRGTVSEASQEPQGRESGGMMPPGSPPKCDRH